MCWQLDPTEGPGRVRRRLMRVPRVTNERHLLPEAVKSPNKYTGRWVDGYVCSYNNSYFVLIPSTGYM